MTSRKVKRQKKSPSWDSNFRLFDNERKDKVARKRNKCRKDSNIRHLEQRNEESALSLHEHVKDSNVNSFASVPLVQSIRRVVTFKSAQGPLFRQLYQSFLANNTKEGLQ